MPEFLSAMLHRLRDGAIMAIVAIAVAMTGAKLTSGHFWGIGVTNWLGGTVVFALCSALSLLFRVAYLPNFSRKVREKQRPEDAAKRGEVTWQIVIATIILMIVWFLSPGAGAPAH